MLKPRVGEILSMSSPLNFLRIVVLPALSSPRIRTLISCSFSFSFLRIFNNPIWIFTLLFWILINIYNLILSDIKWTRSNYYLYSEPNSLLDLICSPSALGTKTHQLILILTTSLVLMNRLMLMKRLLSKNKKLAKRLEIAKEWV